MIEFMTFEGWIPGIVTATKKMKEESRKMRIKDSVTAHFLQDFAINERKGKESVRRKITLHRNAVTRICPMVPTSGNL